MRETAGIFLIIFAYICIAIFILRIIWRVILLLRIPENHNREISPSPKTTFLTTIRMVRDIVFLTRLFRTNPLLWFGEWFFHVTFVLVFIRHLRYILHYVPIWVINLEFAGLLAGYVLPVTLIYILIIKLWVEKKKYFSTGNFFLILLLFLLSVTGIIMKNFIHPDIVDIKIFMSHALAFKFEPAPKSILFIIHFIIAFIFLAYLPAHIFAAPFTLMEARKQEDGLDKIIHEE